ncbi:unnamed protein product [Chironomus riparius]|uniref:Uncharacterized protein n=1 Tax=Chironomus riparius TaxID=315576 RepID=A0A9N9WWY1_9DIPT|nr:unnamed protein product [Chironomus riparius]
MRLNFLGNKCLQPDSIFSFLVKFMLSHNHAFHVACNLCPFGYCYKYFIGSYAAFQIVYSAKELVKHFKETTGEDEELLFHIEWLNIPITTHNFDIIRHTLSLSSNFDLFLRTMTSESVEELISFTFISLINIIYLFMSYCIHFKKLTSEKKFVQFIMCLASGLNLSFLMCYIFENYKNCSNF